MLKLCLVQVRLRLCSGQTEVSNIYRVVNETTLRPDYYRLRASKPKSTQPTSRSIARQDDETQTESARRESPTVRPSLIASQVHSEAASNGQTPFPISLNDNAYWATLATNPEVPLSFQAQQSQASETPGSRPSLGLETPGESSDQSGAYWFSLRRLHRAHLDREARTSFGQRTSEYLPSDLDLHHSSQESSSNDTISLRQRLARRTGCLTVNKQKQWQFFSAMNPISMTLPEKSPLGSAYDDRNDIMDFDQNDEPFQIPIVDAKYEKHLTDLFFAWHNPLFNQIDESIYLEHRASSPPGGDFFYSPALQKAM